MKYEEENLAKELYNELLSEFASQVPEISISVSGEGVHWHCKAIRGNSDCEVHCFDEPEYYIDFNHASQTMATGRTSVRRDVVAAVQSWLDGQGVKDLYAQFDFVDREK
jgi:hypothetical protein